MNNFKKKYVLTHTSNIHKPNPGKNLSILVGGQKYIRLPIRTRLIMKGDDLMSLLEEYVVPHLKPDDIIFISEKILAITQGRIILIKDITPSPLARLLARNVKNKLNTPDFRGFGHGTSRAMELLIREAGYPRAFFAAAVSAVTRPFGIKGLFYFICGKRAKSIDCPMSFTLHPYNNYAKLAPANPTGVAKEIQKKLGNEVVIIDANYIGVFSLGKSNKNIREKFIQAVLKDNPAGQSEEMTPFFIIRKE
jgi:hypothetical protein